MEVTALAKRSTGRLLSQWHFARKTSIIADLIIIRDPTAWCCDRGPRDSGTTPVRRNSLPRLHSREAPLFPPDGELTHNAELLMIANRPRVAAFLAVIHREGRDLRFRRSETCATT